MANTRKRCVACVPNAVLRVGRRWMGGWGEGGDLGQNAKMRWGWLGKWPGRRRGHQ
jgi:hypothetical protein